MGKGGKTASAGEDVRKQDHCWRVQTGPSRGAHWRENKGTFPTHVYLLVIYPREAQATFYSSASCVLLEGYKIVKREKQTSKSPVIIPVNQSWDSQYVSSNLLSSKEMIKQLVHPIHLKQSKVKKKKWGFM